DDRRSVKHLALALKPRLNGGDEVTTYRAYYQDLPVYLERIVTVAAWRGELDFGVRAEDTGRWMIDEPEFRRRWSSGKRMYAFTDRENYEKLKKEMGGSAILYHANGARGQRFSTRKNHLIVVIATINATANPMANCAVSAPESSSRIFSRS